MKFRALLQELYLRDLYKWRRSLSNRTSLPPSEKKLITFQEFYKTKETNQNVIPIFKKSLLNGSNKSIKDFFNQYTYTQLFESSKRLSRQISNICDGSGSSSTVAIFSDNSVLTVLMLWASWMSGQVVIPLAGNKSFDLNSTFIKENNVKLLLSPNKFQDFGQKLSFANNIPLLIIEHTFLKSCQLNEFEMGVQDKIFDGILLNSFYSNSGAFILNELNQDEVGKLKSKTILRTHKDLNKLINMAVQTWHLSGDDRILNITPYNFYNNEFIYSILFPLSVGSRIYILDPFDGKSAWSLILGINMSIKERYNVLMAEPKVYEELLQEYDNIFAKDPKMVEYIKDYCLNNFRLMMTSLSRLDPSVFSAWMNITGHTLLENNFIKAQQMIKNLDDNAHELLHKNSAKIRIVDANRKILFQSKENCINTLDTSVVVGRLMISKDESENFQYTGEIVSCCRGILKIIGRHCCSTQ